MNADEALQFFRRVGVFRCRDFALTAGISRQAALKRLRRAVDAGWLSLESAGRGVRYRINPLECSAASSGSFWAGLSTALPSFRYLNLRSAVGAECRLRRQAESLLSLCLDRFVVIDLRGITSMSGPLARAFVRWMHTAGPQVELINAEPWVARLLAAAERAWRLGPKSD